MHALVAAVLLFGSSCAFAQSLKDLSLEQLGNIEVTTQTKEPEEIWNAAAAVSVLTKEDIRRLGATNIPDLLRLLPGVFVGSVNSSNWAVGVRGFTSNFSKSLLVLIDGRSVYTPLFGGVYWAVQDLVLEDIDRIELIRGPGGTVWGENAVNGVINIITSKSSDTQGVLTSNVAGNLENYNGELRFGGTAGPHFTYRIFGKGFIRGPEIHPNNRDPDGWHMIRGGFRTDSTLGSRDELTVEGDIYKGTSPRETLGADTEDPVSGGDVLARWSHDLSTAHDNSSNFFIQGYVDRTIREGIVGGVKQYTIDLDMVLRVRPNERNNVILGLGYRRNPTQFTQHTPFVNFLPNHQNYDLASLSAQDEIALPGRKLVLTFGLKTEHNIFTNWEIEPTGRILYRPREHQTYWAAVTRAVRVPSQLEENFRLAVPINQNLELLIAGNKNFRPESLLGYEAGYRHLITRDFLLDIAAFFNDYDQLQGFLPAVVQNDPLATPPEPAITTLYGNTVDGSTRGIEFVPDWKVAPIWRLKGSYSLLRYNLKSRTGFSDPASITGYVGSTPLHKWSIQSRIDLPHHFEFDQDLRRVGSLPAQQVPAYITADLRLGWHWKGLDLSVNGRDLLDDGHTEFAAGDNSVATLGVRRSVFAKLVWTSHP
ncbi:MAG TPA: TonB-dependent receptor plug domain-containing protein [Granulicella sp.]|nr:TonB-dependent receptor plug domain-containing protein [Granulicella sp.]